ncbi:uncharacterized protein LOC114195505 isoform X1 [Vigna unguiculata]|uniref:uncharacterized protein LOC114195505 isoform X1 n=1 Tax=Vigna unguiculata TaxID=3917 RepID=UPI001016DEB6|nr:uncharacterized protein LOC114195505 isoform X1 [Vigna unguiculata]
MENMNQFKPTGEPLAPQLTQTEVSSMLAAPTSAHNQVALVPRGATSQIHGQSFSVGYDLFSQVLQKENSLMNPFGLSNEYTASSGQTMRTTERAALPPPLQNDATLNSQRAWTPTWIYQNQFSAADANNPQYYSNYVQYAPVYNPNNQSQVAVHNAYGDQIIHSGQFSRLDQSIALQMRQFANGSTIKPTIPEFPPRRSLFPNPYAKNEKGQGQSADHHKAFYWKNEALMVGRGRVERPWDASKLESGEGSSKRHKQQTNSAAPKQGPNAGPALQGPNSAFENPRVVDLRINSGNNREFVSNSLYDPAYETLGLPIDPHLRLFQALAARGEKGYRMYD